MTLPKPGDELKLRNGWPAKVLAVHPEQGWCTIGEFFSEREKEWRSISWKSNGSSNWDPSYDLMLPKPEPKRLRGWVNVYEDGGISPILDSRDTADNWAKLGAIHRTACLYIDRPYEEGEGL